MKKSTICILAVATALTGIQSAQAGEKERYLLGGLLGGWILNDVTSHSIRTRVHECPSVEVHYRRGSRSSGAVERRRHHGRPSGRYEYRRGKRWMPGCHKRVVTRCGWGETRWVPGHYDYYTEKVWVSHGRNHSHKSGHHDRHDRHDRHARR